MRSRKKLQQFLRPAKVNCDRSSELEEIDKILAGTGGMNELLQEIVAAVSDSKSSALGREGLTGEQILRLGFLRRRYGMSYRGLSEATFDSLSIRSFLNLAQGEGISKSTIQSNLKKIESRLWGKAFRLVVQSAAQHKYENGETLRGDTTTVRTNIHYPTDASLLNDTVRVLTRLLVRARSELGKNEIRFTNHKRRSKTKLFQINNCRSEEDRHQLYLELIRITRTTVNSTKGILKKIGWSKNANIAKIEKEIQRVLPLAEKVVNQSYRRIVSKENVPANEKIVSIFESHTNIIVKGFRDVAFGHKVMLTTGASGLLLSMKVLDGNPKDSTLVKETLEDHKKLFGKAPTMATFDGAFASTENRNLVKAAGVEELTFCKNGAMNIHTLLKTPSLHSLLRNFRSGVEGCISFLKRVFGFSRVADRTRETFDAAVMMGAYAYNLTLLARMRLAREPAS